MKKNLYLLKKITNTEFSITKPKSIFTNKKEIKKIFFFKSQ